MSQTINFASFTVQKTANERTSQAGKVRGQNFKLKYRKFLSEKNKERKIESGYTFSNEKFAELGLHEYGIVQLEGTPYIAIVPNENATMLKRTEKLSEGSEKGKKFKSTILDKTLLEKGVIEDKEGSTQFLDIEKVADATTIGEGTDAIQAIAIYEIVKGVDPRSDEEKAEDAEDEATEVATETPVAETPAAVVAPSVEDDF